MSKKKPTPKKSIQKQTLPKRIFGRIKNFSKKYKIIAVILFIFTAWALIWLSQVAVERYQFHQVEKDLESIAASIADDTNTTSSTKERACHYSSAKFSKGILRCSVDIDFSILVKNAAEANQNINRLDLAVRNNKHTNKLITEYRKKTVFEEKDINSYLDYISADIMLKQNGKFNCSLTYKVSGSSQYFLNVSIGCAKESLLTYFPVKE